MNENIERKSVVSVAEMARMVGLSRGRFYQLVGSAFPYPVHDIKTRRPYYPEALQEVCLEVRKRNCGIDGRPVLFYARRATMSAPKPRKKKPEVVAQVNDHADLIEGLKSLGLAAATTAQVEAAVKSLYPSGIDGTDQGEVLRAIFLHLRAQV
jgi:hypothetical protein